MFFLHSLLFFLAAILSRLLILPVQFFTFHHHPSLFFCSPLHALFKVVNLTDSSSYFLLLSLYICSLCRSILSSQSVILPRFLQVLHFLLWLQRRKTFSFFIEFFFLTLCVRAAGSSLIMFLFRCTYVSVSGFPTGRAARVPNPKGK